MNIAAHEPPGYRAFDPARLQFNYPTYVHIAPSIDYLERAYDEAKYGWYSSQPFLTPVVPTIVDDSLAPPGKHVINVFGGHAPYRLRDGASWADEKSNLTRAGLYLCGSSAHPGGGVSGIPGHNAAREIRRDWKRLRARRAV